ncbi:unnamed protein product [Periconia digitata]|uniref:Uncharacterized protein n=1 Tax=Periconia digitata TaxID=1303443 RepID=A0A9W4UPP4_9PLEO|nr:unnamed protein product [Periconia digitata]
MRHRQGIAASPDGATNNIIHRRRRRCRSIVIYFHLRVNLLSIKLVAQLIQSLNLTSSIFIYHYHFAKPVSHHKPISFQPHHPKIIKTKKYNSPYASQTHTMSTTTIATQYTRLLSLWPKDALRPNLPFTTAIAHRAKPYGVAPPSAPSPSSTPATTPSPQPSASLPTTTPAQETAQINALFSLLENRYTAKYPLSADVLKPKSNPEHYERLMEEIERAPGKTWWQAKVDEWKMKIRWS